MKTTFAALALLATPALAQSPPPAPLPGAGCHVCKVYFHERVEHHRRSTATSRPALEKALDLSYATYAWCVMGSCSDEQLISKAGEIKQVLLNGSVVATSK